MAEKRQLTPRERIKSAYLHLVLGVEQQAIAAAFEVNIGRVSEAITAIELAAGDPREIRAAVAREIRAAVGESDELGGPVSHLPALHMSRRKQ